MVRAPGAVKLMETLHAKRPNHRLVAADFDSLPNVCIEGVNAPWSRVNARAVKPSITTLTVADATGGFRRRVFPDVCSTRMGIDGMGRAAKRTPIERVCVPSSPRKSS